jgi:HD-like signal output (HDOD) protein
MLQDQSIASNHSRYQNLLAAAILSAKAKLAPMVPRFLDRPPIGPMETAAVLERDANLQSRLIRIANTVQHGAGIPVTSLSAAAVRLGTDRMQAIAIAYEITRAVADVVRPAGVDIADFCAHSLARASLARAMAMMRDRNFAGQAFLVGYLQNIGQPLIAAAFPDEYKRLKEEAEGCPLRFAALKYHALNLNHIHAGLNLLESCRFPRLITDAVGRHHTNPPTITATDTPLQLWQIGHVVGLIPVGDETGDALSAAIVRRHLPSQATGDPLARLIRAATEEYNDIADLFEEFAGNRTGAAPLSERVSQWFDGDVITPESMGSDSPARSRTEQLSESVALKY